jgi:hypothetical protein
MILKKRDSISPFLQFTHTKKCILYSFTVKSKCALCPDFSPTTFSTLPLGASGLVPYVTLQHCVLLAELSMFYVTRDLSREAYFM